MSLPSGREPPSNGRIDLSTVSPTDLVLGAIHGFTEHQAETILADPDLLRQLNRLWNAAPPSNIITALAAQQTADGAAQRRLLDAAYARPRVGRAPPTSAGRTAFPPPVTRAAVRHLDAAEEPPGPEDPDLIGSPAEVSATEVGRPIGSIGRARNRSRRRRAEDSARPSWGFLAVAAAFVLVVAVAAGTIVYRTVYVPGITIGPAGSARTFAEDGFDRTVVDGLGTAPIGGPWAVSGEADILNDYAVEGSRGIFRLSEPAVRRTAYLGGARSDTTDVVATASVDKSVAGGPVYLSLIGRQINPQTQYVADVRIDGQNQVRLGLIRYVDSPTGSDLAPTVTLGEVAANEPIHLRMQVYQLREGQARVRAKTWLGSDPEPERWTISAEDETAELQDRGAVGFSGYLSGEATNAPVTISLADIKATTATE
ncbi:MAG TPA: hypothetical protein VLJ88_00785 [Propionibacteriaceae bacterium]|nr:hypothetical protein [Propionibacteriaceae bacterium]